MFDTSSRNWLAPTALSRPRHALEEQQQEGSSSSPAAALVESLVRKTTHISFVQMVRVRKEYSDECEASVDGHAEVTLHRLLAGLSAEGCSFSSER